MNRFKEFIIFKENTANSKEQVISKVKLNKSEFDKEFQPFVVDKNHHSNLRILMKVFERSPDVGTGYTVLDKNKGEIEPKLKKKTLYLTGGAVRDHLKGKTPLNYNLVVDASPSEIEMILNHSKIQKNNPDAKYHYLVDKKDKKNRPVEFLININGTEFYLSPLSKSLKSGNLPVDELELTSDLGEDAKGRDFTINAMYIPLKNYDGENNELIDIYGGAYDLKNGQIVSIGDFTKKMQEDPMVAHRYIRMETRYGNNKKFPEKLKNTTAKLQSQSPLYKKEFLAGYENEDLDRNKYIDFYKDSGLLNNVYPNCNLNYEGLPPEAVGDKFLTSAWFLRDNPIDSVGQIGQSGWSKQEINDIIHLISIYKLYKNRLLDGEAQYTNSPCGLPEYKVNKWIKLI